MIKLDPQKTLVSSNAIEAPNAPAAEKKVLETPLGPTGPWKKRLRGSAKNAAEAYIAAFDFGDRVSGLSWQEKIAQIFSHNDIAGTIAGTGAGDIADRFHEGLNTSRS